MNKEEAISILKNLQLSMWDTICIDKIQEIIEWIENLEKQVIGEGKFLKGVYNQKFDRDYKIIYYEEGED